MATPSDSYTSLDVFAGAGGFSLGLKEAGFESLGAIECDPVAAATLKANFGEGPASLLGPEAGDVRGLSTRTLRKCLRQVGVIDLDLLVASPPCQGFSRVGRGKLDSMKGNRGSFAADSRNGLYEHAIRILRALRPRVFVFENVSGMLHLRGRNIAEDVCDEVARAGYTVRCSLLNAAWYGVPQTRERVIIIGAREDLGVVPALPRKRFHTELSRGHLSGAELDRRNWRNSDFFVDPRELSSVSQTYPAVGVADALDDLPPFTAHLKALENGHHYRSQRMLFPPEAYRHPPRNWYCLKMRKWNDDLRSEDVGDHFCRWTPRDFRTFAQMKPGDRYPQAVAIAKNRYQKALSRHRRDGGRRPVPKDFIPPYPVKSFPDKWRKLIPGLPSWTITAHLGKDTYSHIHFDSTQARSITIREAARIQSFPDAFIFAGNMGDAFRQIGNAVPPLLAREIGEALRSMLAAVDGRLDQPLGDRGPEWPVMPAHP